MSFDAKALLADIDGAKLEALVEVMVLAAAADGDFSDEERAELAASISALAQDSPHEEALSGNALNERLVTAEKELAEAGRDKRIEEVKQRLPEGDARKAALGLAIAVTAADGIVRTSERELIMDLAEGLEIDRDDAADLVRELTRK